MTAVAFVAAIVLAGVMVGGVRLGYELLRQHGRLLLRLESVERQLAQLAALAHGAAGVAASPSLPVGSFAPALELPDLAGARRSLADYRGRRVLLAFFSPTCGYCTAMAPALAALPLDGRDGMPVPIVVSTGDRETNRRLVAEHDIRCPVLLQEEMEVAARYRVTGTPMGYLVDEEGRIASDLAAGAEPLLALARSRPAARAAGPEAVVAGSGSGRTSLPGARPLAESKLLRDGLAPGTPAPGFRLPRVGGGELGIADFRGRAVLLVLSDPHRAPCDRLAPRLESLHRAARDIQVLVVSRGDAEENRRKMAETGLTFPMVLQKQWEISRAYGTFATPAGYLIDERGVVAAGVALGEEAILGLAAGMVGPRRGKEERVMA